MERKKAYHILIFSVLTDAAQLTNVRPSIEIHGYVFRHELGSNIVFLLPSLTCTLSVVFWAWGFVYLRLCRRRILFLIIQLFQVLVCTDLPPRLSKCGRT
ncbi:putative pentatricopeptide repeat-containing protein [Tripterygium wilfordii]|uniref:Putative pentatricopeptide repeat-containing protein n=1 Tax=Tripterygium wilfordii TaxID=458696 RepID=A0A7J7C9R1_TRIWF|nr:putative pentatricopeptide repeat-containing protein [Tripterygium wilfordii]